MKMISLRLNDEELEALRTASTADKLKLTTWIKQAALKAAESRKPVKSDQEQARLPQD